MHTAHASETQGRAAGESVETDLGRRMIEAAWMAVAMHLGCKEAPARQSTGGAGRAATTWPLARLHRQRLWRR